MLGKLIKYDLRYGARTMLALCGAIFVFIAGYPRLLEWQQQRRWGTGFTMPSRAPDAVDAVLNLASTILPMALTGMVFVAFVLMVQLFNKGLYGDEGYLMHTLPVTPWALVGSKAITTTAWLFAALLSVLLGAFIGIDNFPRELAAMFTRGNTGEMLAGIAYTFSGFLSGLLTIYLCIALARLMVQRGVLPVAIGIGIGISIIVNIINAAVFSGMGDMSRAAAMSGMFFPFFRTFGFIAFGSSWAAAMWAMAGYNMLWAGLYYTLTVLCMGRRIKLR